MGLSSLCMKSGNSLGFRDRAISAGVAVHDSTSRSSLELETLHSMAVDFVKTAAPAEMARSLKPREFSDFMQRDDKPMYASLGLNAQVLPKKRGFREANYGSDGFSNSFIKCQHYDNNIPGCSFVVLDDPSIVYPFADENNASSINQQSIHSRTTTEFNNDSTMNFHAKNSNPEHFHQG
ncbi:RNA-dependent RNA polymerase [Theobroma cacao]|nr:RNA-dependent RNA polymerase [Theobroma cacao]